MIVFGTIAASIACWAIAEILRARRTEGTTCLARWAWTAAALLMNIHSIAAFGRFYDWSHDAAYAATARQTAAVAGLDWGGGIFVNYVFLAVWTLDVVWWWAAPRAYQSQPAWLAMAVRGFVVFMFLNGAIVFADGLMRVLGIVAVGAVGLAKLRLKPPERDAPASLR